VRQDLLWPFYDRTGMDVPDSPDLIDNGASMNRYVSTDYRENDEPNHLVGRGDKGSQFHFVDCYQIQEDDSEGPWIKLTPENLQKRRIAVLHRPPVPFTSPSSDEDAAPDAPFRGNTLPILEILRKSQNLDEDSDEQRCREVYRKEKALHEEKRRKVMENGWD